MNNKQRGMAANLAETIGAHERTVMVALEAGLNEGAAMERQAMRRYVRRKMALNVRNGYDCAHIEAVLNWVLTREARYSKKKGGL